MLAIGAGGLDVAVAMAGAPFYLSMPRILGVHLKGSLQPWVTGKDVILEMLRQLTVKGGVGKIVEYFGEGVASLSVSDRFTITNMGAELGATTSVFPSDEQTKRFLVAQQREEAWQSLGADRDAGYDEILEIDLDRLEPMIAQPHSPDAVVPVREVKGIAVQQVCVGSCTNSSYHDLAVAASMVEDRVVHPGVSFTLTPGSKQVFEMIAGDGKTLTNLIAAGARVLESACGPCIGMGQAPSSGAVSIRSFNRNFEGRSGTLNAKVYLASPETCTACALTGEITDPRDLKLKFPSVLDPVKFPVNDNMLIPPSGSGEAIEVIRGPNIKPLPTARTMPEALRGQVLLKVSDNITTDHIMPAGAKVLPLRSNIPAISEFVFERVDPTFPHRAKESGGGFILGGANYGQGSSREHAALAPMYLGVMAVLAKSFARIHWANLINFGILPLTFENELDYDRINQGDALEMPSVRTEVESGQSISLRNVTRNFEVKMKHTFTRRQIELLLAGGLLNHIKQGSSGN